MLECVVSKKDILHRDAMDAELQYDTSVGFTHHQGEEVPPYLSNILSLVGG